MSLLNPVSLKKKKKKKKKKNQAHNNPQNKIMGGKKKKKKKKLTSPLPSTITTDSSDNAFPTSCNQGTVVSKRSARSSNTKPTWAAGVCACSLNKLLD
jgi:hypothetical protein